jgi:hypothetical protein
MLKSMIIFAFLGLGACFAKQEELLISKDACWGDVSSGVSVQGNARLYYFPDERTFLANEVCPEKSIPLSLSSSDDVKIRSLYDAKFAGNRNAIGMVVDVDIVGVSFNNTGSRRVLVRSSKIDIHGDPKPSVIISDVPL